MFRSKKIDRRQFLAASATAAAALVAVPAFVPAAAAGANDRINLGLIGAGARGRYDMSAFLAYPEFRVVAVCDVQADRRNAAKGMVDGKYANKDCQTYRDLRELLAREDIDAVLIATGDRWHSMASILAAKAGKDIYCEKPMSLTIAEGRAVADAVRRHGRVFQCGTQRRSDSRFAYAVEVARSGKLGRLHTIYAPTPGFVRNIGALEARPAEPEPDREVVDWDLWLGPVPWRPYNRGYIGGLGGWSHVPDLGGGGVTDWGTHQADLAGFTNDAETSGPVGAEQLGRSEVAAMYANGVKLVFQEGLRGDILVARFEGTEGWISAGDVGGVQGAPASLLGPYAKDAQKRGEEKPANHIENFLQCIRRRKQTRCNAEAAHRATTACHIANICLRLGRPLKWDPIKEEFPGDEEANRFIGRAIRPPWRL